MSFFYYLIVLVPLAGILGVAFYSRRYVRDVADYLAAGRVAGRYVISIGDLTTGLSVITLVAMCEQNYRCGMAMSFWSNLTIPLSIFMSLTGYCVYRFRQTRCLSGGQFLEVRYSRTLRIVASSIRALADMLSSAIGPAVAVRFLIYFLGIPHRIPLFGMEIPTYVLLVAGCLALALAILWPGGRISLLVTDSIQGIISYPVFVIFAVFVLTNISWFRDVAPVMLDRAPGESFLNPMDIQNLRDFNLFALLVTMTASVLNRAAWFGNDTSNSGRTAHEQKMAGILGTWRNGFSYTALILIGLFVITFMLGGRFAGEAHRVRLILADQVAEEVIDSRTARSAINSSLEELAVPAHTPGVDKPYSLTNNPDIPFLDTVYNVIRKEKVENGNAAFQEFRSLYYQMMMPTLLRNVFPPVLVALFCLLIMMLMISTDNSRIFNAASSIVQDIVIPLKKTPLTTGQHVAYLRRCSLGVTIFFFIASLFFVQLDYINMFVTIVCGIWLGSAGTIMVGGLYTRWGNTCGAWCAMIFGSGSSVLGLLLQRNWASTIYPWLEFNGYTGPVGAFLENVSAPLHPYIVWTMDPIKFPINSMEIYFMSMLLGIAAYVSGSLLTYRGAFNLDRMLHRGRYGDGPEPEVVKTGWKLRNLCQKLVGITGEYTTGDKIIAWSVFGWSIIFTFGFMFCGVLVWNAVSPWSPGDWAVYFFLTTIVTALIVGVVSTVWFMIGGLLDMQTLFRDLNARIANPLDDGRVEGHISLADKEHFKEIEHRSGTAGEQDAER